MMYVLYFTFLDLCMGGEGSGSPDGSFQEILSELDVDKSTLLYESLIYFSQVGFLFLS
jgi:hypothetical protein